ncbi:MAG: VCBS repeat-containing protein [Candidatus Hydrogenedentes bacterium]|nr:VCBS repeat-containing protein [Candidatus Hydrogenedentota bacterium]
MSASCRILSTLLICGLYAVVGHGAWMRHTIDASSAGADGVRIDDANGDGLADIATAWEEGGVVRVYLHPGVARVREPWPQVTVGRVADGEDAVLADLDGDGAMDVLSASEGGTQTLFVHWAPKAPERYLDADAWETQAIPDSVGKTRWMYTLPLYAGSSRCVRIAAGSKNPNGQIGVYAISREPRAVAAWTWHKIHDMGWVMSIAADYGPHGTDLSALIVSNRRTPHVGCFAIAPPTEAQQDWQVSSIAGPEHEWMFLDYVSGPMNASVVCATSDAGPVLHAAGEEPIMLALPPGLGTGKGVARGDFDGDGAFDLVYSCENVGGKMGVILLRNYADPKRNGAQDFIDVSGLEGTKFDRVEVIDLDGDGDPDILTCEEREGLGVIWYENPRK